MFFQFSSNIVKQIESVSRSIDTYTLLIDVLSDKSLKSTEIADIRTVIPTLSEWRVLEHCAVITRLYSIFEGFIDASLTDLISYFPTISNFSGFSEKFRNHYRDCIGAIINKIEHRQYRSLSLKQVIQDYLNALNNEKRYSLLPHALLRRERNLKPNILHNLFNSLGISDVRSWITNHRHIKYYFKKIRGSNETFESELTSFVEYRNDASHGTPSDVLGTGELKLYCEFIKAICKTVEELLNHWLITKYVEIGKMKSIGTVTKEYSNNIAIVNVVKGKLKKNTTIVLRGSQYCYDTEILEIQINDEPKDEIIIRTPKEVGLRTKDTLFTNGYLYLPF